ncbi:hypothetical protein DdX_13425 [Ditylenchus destructor]|uniref:F-box domain-containing protein n=1 Tax=Ditylenchus destructor TaxID=166010 RepID=A0AAD4R2U7_9BILA|nr:hypothetical protein DdX_13425 [Ditylenchus destructor]
MISVYNLRPRKRVKSPATQIAETPTRSKRVKYSQMEDKTDCKCPSPSAVSVHLNPDVLRETFRFFNRRDLCSFLHVNGRLRALIRSREFTSKPFLLFKELEYSDERDRWICHIEKDGKISKRCVPFSVNFPKYLRFKSTNIYEAESMPMRALFRARHVWDSRRLTIGWNLPSVPIIECLRLVHLSRYLILPLLNAAMFTSEFLPKLLNGSCEHIAISGCQFASFDKLPQTDILHFLFKAHGNENELHYLRIYNGPLFASRRRSQVSGEGTGSAFHDFIEIIKKEFLSTDVAFNFKFEWGQSYSTPTPWLGQEFSIRHPKTNQTLELVDDSAEDDDLFSKRFFLHTTSQ